MAFKESIPMDLKKPLTQKELEELFKSRDNPENREKIILHNLRLVSWVANKYHAEGRNEFEDIFQVGVIGLMKAIDKYNPEKGAFTTYALWWIRQSITRYLSNYTRTIRIPCHIIERISELNKLMDKMTQELGREPTTRELSKRMGVSIKTINKMMTIMKDPVSLQTTVVGDSDDLILEEAIADEGPTPDEIALDNVLVRELKDAIRPLLSDLEYKAFMLFYGINSRVYSLTEVARMFNKTPEEIRNARDKAKSVIRSSKFIQEIEKEIDMRTLFYSSPDYSTTKVRESRIGSPVERAVLKREEFREYLINKYIKTG